MRSRTALGLLIVLALAGCGGSGDSPERVVRAWIQALNADDNERAATLFAADAKVIQGDVVLRLHTRREAVAWNSALPCAGVIVNLERKGDTVSATFLLGDRRSHHCDGPGGKASALFVVRNGRIVLWQQTGSQAEPPGGGTA